MVKSKSDLNNDNISAKNVKKIKYVNTDISEKNEKKNINEEQK